MSTFGRAVRRAAVAGLLSSVVVGLLFVWPGRIAAHANLARSLPPSGAVLDTAPAQVQLWFTEPPEGQFSEVHVLDMQGNRVDLADSRPAPGDALSLVAGLRQGLPNGAYIIVWKVVSSVDGHTTRGTVPFAVGLSAGGQGRLTEEAPAGAVSGRTVAEALARWATLLGLLVGAGSFGFSVLVWRGVVQGVGPQTSPPEGLTVPFGRMAAAGAGVALAASLVLIGVQAWDAGGDFGASLGRLLLDTRLGYAFWARAALLVLTLVLTWRWRVSGEARLPGVGLGVMALALLTVSVTGHGAAAFRWVWAAVIGDWLHLIAVATWAGALPCLLIAVVVIARGAEGARRRRLLVETVSRFSGVAVAAVVVIALTGVFSAYLHVGSFGAAASGYGLALIVKTTLFGGVLTAAGVNLLVVRPRLKASGRGQSPEGGTARRLRLALMVETALAVFVIGASGFLASMDTARRLEGAENVGTAASFRRESGGLSLWLRVSYLGGGQHRIAVTASEGPRGVIAVDRAVVRLRYLVRDVGESEVVLPQRGEGYEAQGLLLPLAGMWQIELLPLRSGPAAPERFRVTVVASGLVYPTAEEVAQDAAGRAVPLALAGMVLAIALAGVFRAGMLPRRQRRQAAFTALGSVCVGVVGMAALVGQVNAMRGHTDVPLVSPFPATTGSVVAGEALYERHCVVCHGVSGRGDGPAAAGLSPRPADLPVHVPLHSDRQLYVWISEGLPGTAMPAFRDNLRPEERWHLLNYLKKQFAPQDR